MFKYLWHVHFFLPKNYKTIVHNPDYATAAPPPSTSDDSGGSNTTAIVIGVLAGVVVLGIIAGLGFWQYRRVKARNAATGVETAGLDPDARYAVFFVISRGSMRRVSIFCDEIWKLNITLLSTFFCSNSPTPSTVMPGSQASLPVSEPNATKQSYP